MSGASSPDLACTETPTVLDILLWLATGEALYSHRASAPFAAFLLALYHRLQFVPANNPYKCCRKLYSRTNDPFPLNYSFSRVFFFFLHLLDVLRRPLSFGIHSQSQTSLSVWIVPSLFYVNVKFSVLCLLSVLTLLTSLMLQNYTSLHTPLQLLLLLTLTSLLFFSMMHAPWNVPLPDNISVLFAHLPLLSCSLLGPLRVYPETAQVKLDRNEESFKMCFLNVIIMAPQSAAVRNQRAFIVNG